jgi:2-dehydro-3-deoxygalactonokinase
MSTSPQDRSTGTRRGPAARHGAIVLDWGSSRLRAWLLDGDGAVLARRATDDGALGVPAGGFDAVLVRVVGDWAAARPDAPLLACGMVGARGAWVEAPYAALPADVNSLRDHCAVVATSLGRPLLVVGGLRTDEPDVLRGEETQAMGCGLADGLLCVPGTHAKWLVLRGGAVTGFATWFTGELFALLGAHGSLARAFGSGAGSDHAVDAAGFDAGVARALDARSDARWLHELFGFRARVVGAGADGAFERSQLSGWLIGTELRQALDGDIGVRPPEGVAGALGLVAEPALAALYQRALPAVRARLDPATGARVPSAFVVADADCAARGLWRISAAAPT